MTRPDRDDRIGFADLEAIRQALRGYRGHLKAQGKDPNDTIWLERIRAALQEEGLTVREKGGR